MPEDGEWGLVSNGSWTGLVGMLARKVSLIALCVEIKGILVKGLRYFTLGISATATMLIKQPKLLTL